MLGGGRAGARDTASAAALLLPQSSEAIWSDIRSVELDERRHVVSLGQGRLRRLRLYATAANFDGVAAFVRRHVPARAPNRPAGGRMSPRS